MSGTIIVQKIFIKAYLAQITTNCLATRTMGALIKDSLAEQFLARSVKSGQASPSRITPVIIIAGTQTVAMMPPGVIVWPRLMV